MTSERVVQAKVYSPGKVEVEFPDSLMFVVERLRKAPQCKLYLVGPAVRDAVLTGDISKLQRYDMYAVGLTTGQIQSLLDGASNNQFFVGKTDASKKFVTVSVQAVETGEIVRRVVITAVQSGASLVDELIMREVTVNAIAMDLEGNLICLQNALDDLKAGIIRPTFPADLVFAQRPLYLLKVAKHIAFHGFSPSEDTVEHASKNASHILDVPSSKWRPEFERMLVNLYPAKGLDFLHQTGVLKFILPEVELTVDFHKSCPVHHKDLWYHTKMVVQKSKPHVAVRWAALLHDIGKVWTRTVDENNKVHFFKHEQMSALLADGICYRFGLEENLKNKIRNLVINHPRLNQYSSEWTDSAIRRLIRDIGDDLDDLIALSRADITSKFEDKVEYLLGLIDELEERVKKIREQDAKQPLLPKGTGNVIMRHFGIPPGPLVGQLKKVLEQAIESGVLPAGQPVESYMGFLEEYIRKYGKETSG